MESIKTNMENLQYIWDSISQRTKWRIKYAQTVKKHFFTVFFVSFGSSGILKFCNNMNITYHIAGAQRGQLQ